jgi:hypothetical protein
MDTKYKIINSAAFVPSKPEKSEDYYILLADKAEEIKSKAYNAYYFGKSFDENTNGLRTVLGCHFIKTNCQRVNNGSKPIDYQSFKKGWLDREKNNSNKEIIKWL